MPKAFVIAGLIAVAVVFGPAGPAAAVEKSDDLSAASKLSTANQALYTTNHLKSITHSVRLNYGFKKTGTLENGFTDKIIVNVKRVLPSGRKDLEFTFLTGKNKVRFRPMQGFNGNPVFMLFLERDVREMQRMTGGNALYFRTRIRNAIAAAETHPTTFTFRGKTYQGTEIRIQPYRDSDLISRFPQFSRKTYIFMLSKDIPGGFYQIRAMTPAGKKDVELTDERLTFNSMTEAGSASEASSKESSKK